MISRCTNCAAKLVFDPKTQKLSCERCGSQFNPQDFNVPDSDPVWDKQPSSLNEILGTDSEEYMDCYVYTCSSCGGEIIINGKEASTQCIYCGNPSVIFSRIARRKKPTYILPFKTTREYALDNIRSELKKGLFVPKQLKNFKADDVRGIYIPYWLVNVDHYGAVIVKSPVLGEPYVSPYGWSPNEGYRQVSDGLHERAGSMKIVNFPVEASKVLSNDSSIRLEPFGLQALKPFDEDYLLGFYSDIPDITYGELKRVIQNRACVLFDEAVMDRVEEVGEADKKEIIDERHSTAIDYHSIRCAMLPVWFVTYDYDGKHNTILVNGQTGKVVGGFPWNKKLFFSLLFASGILFSGITFFAFDRIGVDLLHLTGGVVWALAIASCVAIISILSVGIANIRSVSKSLDLTQSGSMFNFVKKRQG